MAKQFLAWLTDEHAKTMQKHKEILEQASHYPQSKLAESYLSVAAQHYDRAKDLETIIEKYNELNG
jgi:hypothetical protein